MEEKKSSKIWDFVVFVLIGGLVVGLAVWYFGYSCERWEKDKLAIEKYISGKSSTIMTVELSLCNDLLIENLCPTSIVSLDKGGLNNITDQQLRQNINELFDKILTYNQGCKNLKKIEQENDLLFLYRVSQRLRYSATATAMVSISYGEMVKDCENRLAKKYPSSIKARE
jgi:hypothetical protein